MKTTLKSEKEAAFLLGISRPTLLRLRQSGAIAFHRVASRVLYSEEQLDAFLRATERQARARA